MKKQGCKVDYAAARGEEVKRAFRKAWECAASMVSGYQPDVDHVAALAVRFPAPRFYVSEERAAAVVGQMMRGEPVTDGMRESKRRMYAELLRRVRLLRAKQPAATLVDLVASVIYEPAPEFYIEPATALFIMSRMRTAG
ncbi:MAG: hypothetical protein K2N16_07125 [Muribaculaceae bacterium]|nr:hypothetical protein [Muribaculaceae bacterium]